MRANRGILSALIVLALAATSALADGPTAGTGVTSFMGRHGPVTLRVADIPAPIVYPFSGDGSTTTFPLSPPVDPTKINVNISGVPQGSANYTATSSSINFVAPPPAGSAVIVVYGGVASGTPSSTAPAYSGDVTSSAGSTVLTIALGAVTNAKMGVGAAAANLGFAPLSPANNLSDVPNATAARANLGLNVTAAPGDISTAMATTAFVQYTKQFKTFQDFGAVGDGVTDATAAVQTALNSGIPIACVGNFAINGLVTSTHHDASIKGFGIGCHFIYNTAQSMIWFNETGNSQYASEQILLEDIQVDVNNVITGVTGPAHTAAFYISYVTTSGVAARLVTARNVKIKPTSPSNYILNGIYLNEATNAYLENTSCEMQRNYLQVASNCIVYDGTHSPTALTVQGGYCDFCGIGVFAPQQTALGWQGIRIHDFDCVYCSQIVTLRGALDGLSDQAVVDGTEGAFQDAGITVSNTTHVAVHDNYVFMADIPLSGASHNASPTCYNNSWTVAIVANGASDSIHDNTCDGAQVTGYTNRYGIVMAGNAGTNMVSTVGASQLTNLDIGVSLQAGTAGVVVTSPSTRNVGTPLQRLSTAGANAIVAPTSY